MSRLLTIGLLLALTAADSTAQTPPAEKKGTMLLDLKKILPPEPKAAEQPKPAVTPMAEPEKKPEEIPETPQERFKSTKARAVAGNSQAQYELALIYAQEFERTVTLDNYEAYTWLLKAAAKNHKMAQYYLGRFYEDGQGMDGADKVNALSWRRSAALLGCRQSQKWMGQLYYDTFSGNKKFADQIKQDPSNLVEAYAWYDLAASNPLPARADAKTPSEEEVASGDVPLNVRDFNFERAVPANAARNRDTIAKLPGFNRKMFEDAKERSIALAKEAADYRAKNRPK
jgi:hypothetical protein